ncbi:MAG: ferredoxin thioredoxin reductase catalytic beta chain [Clostridia bacterium]|nr:ferredoxin thioredoxin reductase catalytic beta chain [Clostridia bacterium]
MAVRLNENKELVAKIQEGLKKRDGYCPCRLPKIEEYKCICDEFRKQIADPDFEGYCHCKLYYKSRDEKQG